MKRLFLIWTQWALTGAGAGLVMGAARWTAADGFCCRSFSLLHVPGAVSLATVAGHVVMGAVLMPVAAALVFLGAGVLDGLRRRAGR